MDKHCSCRRRPDRGLLWPNHHHRHFADGSQLQYLNTAQYPLLLNGFCFDQIVTLLIPPSMSGLGSAPTFEFAFSDGFVPPQGGAIKLYSTWQAATTTGNPITLPSIFQTNEMPIAGGIDGLTVTEQIYVCANSSVFCTDSNALVGMTTIADFPSSRASRRSKSTASSVLQ